MQPEHANPWMEAGFTEIAEETRRLIGELESTKPRSRTERERLVRDTRLLLLAVSTRILHFGEHVPDTPERQIAIFPDKFAEPFRRWYEREVVSLRMRTLSRASALVHGNLSYAWMTGQADGTHLSGPRPTAIALERDDGLFSQLERLEKNWRSGPAAKRR